MGNAELVQALLAAGAKPALRNAHGDSAMDASRSRQFCVGASLATQSSRSGERPLEVLGLFFLASGDAWVVLIRQLGSL